MKKYLIKNQILDYGARVLNNASTFGGNETARRYSISLKTIYN